MAANWHLHQMFQVSVLLGTRTEQQDGLAYPASMRAEPGRLALCI